MAQLVITVTRRFARVSPQFRPLMVGLPAPPAPASRYCIEVYTQCMLTGMSVPMALLGLLDREPSHGYDLKRDYDTYFSRGRPLAEEVTS